MRQSPERPKKPSTSPLPCCSGTLKGVPDGYP
uniref:Uncharacterized protein n=1 Tax=Arundo donax TaxID=35708 RepID=A0A0A9ASW8_ARUDO